MNGDTQNCDSNNGDLIRTDCDYVNEGILNWLNNKPKQAEQFLKGRIERTPVLAAYSFVLCMVCCGMPCLCAWICMCCGFKYEVPNRAKCTLYGYGLKKKSKSN